jgi:enoyl-CoA hydratase/carnithine racemase
MSAVTVEDAEGIRTIVLDRPESLNAVSRGLATELLAALEASADPAVAAVVLTGRGRAFSAGADLEELSTMTADGIEAWYRPVAAAFREILRLDKPVVAALNGAAAGAGYQIALVSDWRVGNDGTRLSQPEIVAGMPSIMGSYWMTLHLPWGWNQELSYSGRAVDAAEARALGLLQDVVEHEEVVPTARRRAAELAAKAPVAFRATKARFRELALRGFDEAHRAAVEGMAAAFASGEPQAVMKRFLARRRRGR